MESIDTSTPMVDKSIPYADSFTEWKLNDLVSSADNIQQMNGFESNKGEAARVQDSKGRVLCLHSRIQGVDWQQIHAFARQAKLNSNPFGSMTSLTNPTVYQTVNVVLIPELSRLVLSYLQHVEVFYMHRGCALSFRNKIPINFIEKYGIPLKHQHTELMGIFRNKCGYPDFSKMKESCIIGEEAMYLWFAIVKPCG